MKYLLKHVLYPLFMFGVCCLSIWLFIEDRSKKLFEERYGDKFR